LAHEKLPRGLRSRRCRRWVWPAGITRRFVLLTACGINARMVEKVLGELMCDCADVRMCECANVQMCRCANVQMCECADVKICGCEDMQMRSYANAGWPVCNPDSVAGGAGDGLPSSRPHRMKCAYPYRGDTPTTRRPGYTSFVFQIIFFL
jgi:hypothetical protein